MDAPPKPAPKTGQPFLTRRLTRDRREVLVIELPSFRFRATEGNDSGRQWELTHEVIRIGTHADNDVVLADDSASAFHARIDRVERGLRLRDLDSTNGTYVNGVPVQEAYVVPESLIRIGRTVLRVEADVQSCFAVSGSEERLGPLVGRSAPMRELYAMIRAVAPTSASVLIEGESGTGKDLAARLIHELSGRTGPLIVFDCAATSPELIASELFGHRPGAFTGADRERTGAFREAHRGTLFLDELASLPMSVQAHLLRALEAREVKPLGADRPVEVDVRLVAATNRNLSAMVAAGTFRLDLLHRLSVITLRLPALRDRPGDMEPLIDHLSARLGLTCRFGPAAREALARTSWPGNVRELRNTLERVGILARDREITPGDLALGAPTRSAEDAVESFNLELLERTTIRRALDRCGGHRGRAAELLGISAATLHRRLKDWGQADDSDEGSGK